VARDSDSERADWLERALGLFATVVPFALSVARAAGSGQWRDDLPAVRDLGLVAVGVGGGLSTLLTQALGLLPLGSRVFRASFGSALALGLAAHLFYGLVRWILREARAPLGKRGIALSPRLDALLALIATLTAALSPTWQREATVGGGAMIATAIGLWALSLALKAFGEGAAPAGARVWIGLGALSGAALAESPPAALSVLGMVGAVVLVRRFDGRKTRLPAPRVLGLGVLAGAFVAVLLSAPLFLRPLAPRAWVDIGRALSTSSLSGFDMASARTTALHAWVREIGLVSLLIAGAGGVLALGRRATRVFLAPLLVLVGLDLLLPARAAGVLTADPLTALRSLAVAAIAVGSALGVKEGVRRLLETRVPMSRAGAVLVVVFHLTLVALASEEAGFAADRSEQFAAEVWTDEALGELEPNGAVLVRSPALAWRLWAARLTRGERPDVVVIPVPLLGKGRVAGSLAVAEPVLEPLLRDFALSGAPSEFALSRLSDVRPLHVEFDAGWSRRLLSHVTVDGLWLEYAPEPLGQSDRKMSAKNSLVPLGRVLGAIEATTLPDAPTSSVVATTLRTHASTLSALGEHDASDMFLDRVEQLSMRDPLVGKMSLPYALKGVRRAVAKRALGRQR